MKAIITWIKANWADPVWSKVFAWIIIAAIGFVTTLSISLLKKISFANIYQYLKSYYIFVNLIAVIIIISVSLSFIIPGILFYFRLIIVKREKGIKELDLNKEYEEIVNGKWKLMYVDHQSKGGGEEILEIKNGTNYSISGNLVFILRKVSFNKRIKTLCWEKFRVTNQQTHSVENLQVINNNTLIGSDNIGFKLTYVRLS